MEFRKAASADIPDLCALRRLQLADEGQDPHPDIGPAMEAYFASALAQDRLVEFLAEEDGRIAATGAVSFLQFPPAFSNPTGLVAYVTNMYTAPDFRGRGLASRLLELLEEECRERGVLRMLLAASSQGERVYRRYGFQPEGNWFGLWLNGGPGRRPAPLDNGAADVIT